MPSAPPFWDCVSMPGTRAHLCELWTGESGRRQLLQRLWCGARDDCLVASTPVQFEHARATHGVLGRRINEGTLEPVRAEVDDAAFSRRPRRRRLLGVEETVAIALDALQ